MPSSTATAAASASRCQKRWSPRIDVGFSDEEQGLTYLEFGQTF